MCLSIHTWEGCELTGACGIAINVHACRVESALRCVRKTMAEFDGSSDESPSFMEEGNCLASLLHSRFMMRCCCWGSGCSYTSRPLNFNVMNFNVIYHVPLLNLNRAHAPSKGDGHTIYYIYRQRRC